MVKFIASGQKHPCPICGRGEPGNPRQDGDCRISLDEGLVLCHTEVNHREKGEELNGHIYIGEDEGGLWGRWRAKTADFVKERPVGQQFRYPFTDRSGRVVVEEVRVYKANGKDSWMEPAGVDTGTLLPYRYAEAIAALQAGAPHCFIVEGPPKSDALWEIGFPAVTFAIGFKPSRDSHWFEGYEDRLVIVPDQDKPGMEKAAKVALAYPMAKSFRPWPNSARWLPEWIPEKGGADVRDWVDELRRRSVGDEEIQGMILAGIEDRRPAAPVVESQVTRAAPAATEAPAGRDDQAKPTNEDGYSTLIQKLTKIFTQSETPSRQQWDLGAMARSTKMSIGFLTQLYNTYRAEKEEINPKSFKEFRDEGSEEREWVIAGFLPRATTAILHSDAGTGKTLLLYDMCKAVVTGSQWNGMPTQQGKVLIVQTDEPSSETRQRLEISGFFDVVGENGAILTRWGFTQIHKLRRWIDINRPSLVVIDSLTTVNRHSQVEEKDSAFAHGLLDLRDIADDYGCAIVVLHHSNRKGGLRGTGAIDAGVSEIWHLRRGKPTEGHLGQLHRILEIGKSRAGCSGTYQLELDPEDYHWNYQGEVGTAPAGHEPAESPATLLAFFNLNPGIWFEPEELAELNGHCKGNKEAVRKQCQRLSRKGLIREESRTRQHSSGAKRYKVYQAASKNNLPDTKLTDISTDVRQMRPSANPLTDNDFSNQDNLPDTQPHDQDSVFENPSSTNSQKHYSDNASDNVRQVTSSPESLLDKAQADGQADGQPAGHVHQVTRPAGDQNEQPPDAPATKLRLQIGDTCRAISNALGNLGGLNRLTIEGFTPEGKVQVRNKNWHPQVGAREVDLTDIEPVGED